MLSYCEGKRRVEKTNQIELKTLKLKKQKTEE